MPRTLDPTLAEILKRYNLDPEEALWDCHGTWVMFHRVLERVAAQAGITFDYPEVFHDEKLEQIAVIVRATLGEQTTWTFGEAAPRNNKNPYPWAMAEKRAKGRCILKLLGLHGYVYSDEEADEFKNYTGSPKTTPPSHSLRYYDLLETIELPSWDRKTIIEWWNDPKSTTLREGLSRSEVGLLKDEIAKRYPRNEPNDPATDSNDPAEAGDHVEVLPVPGTGGA